MGEVFLARRRQSDGEHHFCVVKTLRSDLTNDKGYVRRFIDEARIVVQLDHPNVCGVWDAGKVGSEFFLTMEYIAGSNLRDLHAQAAEEADPLPIDAALHVGVELLSALSYAHDFVSPVTGEHLRLVHRDVSPHNTMISYDGTVKLIDFGLADSTVKEEHTESAVVMGKVAYMSPEQARGQDVDATCDQFAAAVVLFEALSGERFYGDMSLHKIWQIVGMGDYRPKTLATFDPPLRRILERALAGQTIARFPSCAAMRDALLDYRTARGLDAGKESLRAIMERRYVLRIAWDQEVRAAFAGAEVPMIAAPVDAAAAAAAPQTEAIDVQVSREASRTMSATVRRGISDATERVRPAHHAPSLAAVPQPARASLAPYAVAAGAGLVALVLGVVVATGDARETPPGPPVVTAPAVAPIVDAPRIPAPPIEAPPALAVTDASTAPATNDVAAPPTASAQPLIPAVATSTARRGTGGATRRGERAAGKAAATTTTTTDPAPPAPPPEVPPAKPTAQRHTWEQAQAIYATCGKPCAVHVRTAPRPLTQEKFEGSGREGFEVCLRQCDAAAK